MPQEHHQRAHRTPVERCFSKWQKNYLSVYPKFLLFLHRTVHRLRNTLASSSRRLPMPVVSTILTLSILVSCLRYVSLFTHLRGPLTSPSLLDPLWWITQLFAWPNVGDAIAGSILLLQADHCENRLWGSRHTIAISTCSFLFAALAHGIWIYFMLDNYCGLQSGPLWAVFPFTGKYVMNAPIRARWRVAYSCAVTDKWLVLLLAIQLSCSNIPDSLLISLPSFVIGIVFGSLFQSASLPELLVPACQIVCSLSPGHIVSCLRWAHMAWNNLDLRTTQPPTTASVHLAGRPAALRQQAGTELGHSTNAYASLNSPQTPSLPLEDDDEATLLRVLLLSQQTAAQEQSARQGLSTA